MKKFILIIFAIMFANSAFSTEPAELLQQKLDAIHTMKATFTQVISTKSRQISQTSGTMALLRPGKFRWDTVKPAAQLVVADGNKLWVYDEDLEQVTVKEQQKDIGGMAALFLSGGDNKVSLDFEVKTNKIGDVQTFDLKAKSSKENFQRVKLDFSGATLTSMELFDQLGQRTSVRLNNVKLNSSLDAKLFKFSPPEGVDVVQQ